MSDTKTPDGKTLSVKPTLSLKRSAEAGVVRQSFSHGRSKQVVVEVKKRRTHADGKPEAAAPAAAAPVAKRAAPAAPAAKTATPVAAPAATPAPAAAAPKASGVVLRTLTDEERNRRAHALGDARLREAEERKIAEEEAKIRQQRDAIEKTSARPPRRASARKTSAASTTKSPRKRPTRLPRSASARARRPPVPAHGPWSKRKKTKHRNSGAVPEAPCARPRRRSVRPAPPRPRPSGRAAG